MGLKPLKIANIIERVQQEDANLINWGYISEAYELPEPFIEKYKNKVNWYRISRYQKLSPEFVQKHIDKITEDIFDNPCYKDYPDSLKLLLKQKFNK